MTTQEIKNFFAKVEEVAAALGWGNVEIAADGPDLVFRWEETWSYGGHESVTTSLPMEWMELPVDEIVVRYKAREAEAVAAANAKKEREIAEKAQRDAEASEKRDRANYERLKAKYEAIKDTDQ